MALAVGQLADDGSFEDESLGFIAVRRENDSFAIFFCFGLCVLRATPGGVHERRWTSLQIHRETRGLSKKERDLSYMLLQSLETA